MKVNQYRLKKPSVKAVKLERTNRNDVLEFINYAGQKHQDGILIFTDKKPRLAMYGDYVIDYGNDLYSSLPAVFFERDYEVAE